jgi:hypothetical protein
VVHKGKWQADIENTLIEMLSTNELYIFCKEDCLGSPKMFGGRLEQHFFGLNKSAPAHRRKDFQTNRLPKIWG